MLLRFEDDDDVGAERDQINPPALHRMAWVLRFAGRGAHAFWVWKRTVATVAAVTALVAYFGVPATLGPKIPVNPIIRADLIKTVVASGHVEAPFRVGIASQIVGVVSEVAAAEGQAVKAGQVLIRLDDRETRAAVSHAQGLVAQAEARVRQMRELTLPSADESLKQAQATLTNAQKSFDRAAILAKTGYGTRATLDDATRALDVARAAVRNAEVQVYTNRPGGSDYVMAETLLEQARANLESAQSKLSYTVISAPRDGILIAHDVEVGDVVQPGVELMKLSPHGETQLVVQIDEKNLGLLALGQKALVSADAYPTETFDAEVVYINPGIDLKSATVEVKLRVPKPPDVLREDMTVSVDIEVQRRPSTLIAQSGDVHDLDTASPWVFKVENGRAMRRPVRVGLIGIGQVEILEGVTEGSAVIPVSTLNITDGQRIRPRGAVAGPQK